jgi:hypothetical protein
MRIAGPMVRSLQSQVDVDSPAAVKDMDIYRLHNYSSSVDTIRARRRKEDINTPKIETG